MTTCVPRLLKRCNLFLTHNVATLAPPLQTQVAGLDGEGREEEYTDTAQEHNWAASTTSQQWHLPEGVREATEVRIAWQKGRRI